MRVTERIHCTLCVLVCQCLHGAAPTYLAWHSETRRRRRFTAPSSLRASSSTSMLRLLPSTRRSTVGDRAFPVAAARASNSQSVIWHPRRRHFVYAFRQRLKAHLFRLFLTDNCDTPLRFCVNMFLDHTVFVCVESRMASPKKPSFFTLRYTLLQSTFTMEHGDDLMRTKRSDQWSSKWLTHNKTLIHTRSASAAIIQAPR